MNYLYTHSVEYKFEISLWFQYFGVSYDDFRKEVWGVREYIDGLDLEALMKVKGKGLKMPSVSPYIRLFVLTPVVKKIKTQAQNSSQNTQALGGFFQRLKKLKKKHKIECFSGGWYPVCHFYCQICSKTGSFILKDPKVSKFVHKFLKLRGKFPKLKKNSRKKTSFGRISPHLRDQVML